MMVKAYYTVRNPRRTWSGAPPDPADAGSHRAPDLEVGELQPLSSVPDQDATAALLFAGGAHLYLENATRTDQLRDGQIIALSLELELDVGEPAPAPTPQAGGRSAAHRGRAG